MKCIICKDDQWTCEDHPDQPWDNWHQVNCGAGQPCICNSMHERHLTEDAKRTLEEFDVKVAQILDYKK